MRALSHLPAVRERDFQTRYHAGDPRWIHRLKTKGFVSESVDDISESLPRDHLQDDIG